MRLVAYDRSGRPALAVRRGDDLLDLAAAAPDLPQTLEQLLAAGGTALKRAAEAARTAGREALVAGAPTYLPPLSRSAKVVCIGLNYTDHAAETNLEVSEHPVVFVRFPSSLTGHGQPLFRPACSQRFDWEGELVVVIGKRARHVARRDALDYVAGYTIMNEGSIRDYQFRTSQWTMGKNFDSSGALGPELVTADELPAAAKGLRLKTRVNGEVMQDASTDNMIFDVPTLIESISEAFALAPGDCIATGTPAGVGVTRKPPRFMRAGDVCEVEIEGIGTLVNPVQDERPPA